MESRRESRLQALIPASITLLHVQEPQQESGWVVEISGRGARLHMDVPIPCGTLLKIELRDQLLLGEAVHSVAADGGYTIGIRLSHSLSGLAELQQLNRALLGYREESAADLVTSEVNPRARELRRP